MTDNWLLRWMSGDIVSQETIEGSYAASIYYSFAKELMKKIKTGCRNFDFM